MAEQENIVAVQSVRVFTYLLWPVSVDPRSETNRSRPIAYNANLAELSRPARYHQAVPIGRFRRPAFQGKFDKGAPSYVKTPLPCTLKRSLITARPTSAMHYRRSSVIQTLDRFVYFLPGFALTLLKSRRPAWRTYSSAPSRLDTKFPRRSSRRLHYRRLREDQPWTVMQRAGTKLNVTVGHHWTTWKTDLHTQLICP